MATSYVDSLELELNNSPERSLSSTFNSNHDWKLSQNVQVKIVLQKLQIQTEIHDHKNHNRPTKSEITPVPRGAKRQRMSNASPRSPGQTQTETSESGDHSSSDEAMEELEKIVLAFEPECSICCKFVHQFSQHIRNLHSSSPPPSTSTRRSKIRGPGSSVKIETEIFTVVPSNNGENNNNVCDKLLPSTADLQTRLEPNIKSEIQESHQMNRRKTESEVTGHRRSPLKRKMNQYAESINEPQPTATVCTEEADNSPTSNDIPHSLTVEYVKCEPGEIEITDNYDLFRNSDPEGHHGNEADSDVGEDRDEDSELEGERSNPGGHPYKCVTCPAGFKKLQGLVHHKKTHTAGESSGSSSVIPRKTIDAVPDSLTETDSDGVGTGQRRSSRVRKKINYAESNEGPLHITELEIEFSEYNRAGVNNNQYCHICRLNIPTEKGFIDHIKSTHEDNLTPYRCNICKTGFPTGPDIRTHFIQTHPKNNLEKRLVNESDSDADATPDYPYKCEHCNRGFELPKHLELHMTIHTKEKPHKCETCSKSFYLKDVLMSHQSRHYSVDKPSNASEVTIYNVKVQGERSVKKNYGCGICTSEHNNMNELTRHLQKTHINILSNKFICKFCKEGFFTVKMLGVHVGKVHPGEKPFECNICHKEFTNRYMLIDHSDVHKEEKTIMCTHKGCTKMFKKISTMKTHLILHTGDRPYKCEQCGKTFATWTILSIHKMTHSSEKPFMCEICSTCFSRKCSLDLHMLSHQEEGGVKYKPHVCKDCGRGFTQKGQLTTHSKIHTGEKSHMCEECGICFRLPHQLRAHLKTLAHTKS